MSDTEIELQPETPAPKPGPLAHLSETAAVAPSEPAADLVAAAEPSTAARTPRRRAASPGATGFPWEVSPLAQFPMAELLAEIHRRHARAKVLLAERERILAKMAALEAEMGMVGSTDRSAAPASRPTVVEHPRRQRAKNSVSLADALSQAVEVRATVSPAEAAQLVLANGYQTTAAKFGMVVANALSNDQRFKRVGRGRYERIQA